MPHVAEYNLARLREPLEAASNTEFMAVLDAVNQIAEVSDGFVWRLTTEDGRSSTHVQVYEDPLLIVNFSVWTDLDSLRNFTYRSGHSAYFRRRREWFEEGSSKMVCWWIEEGEIPSVDDAMHRLTHLALHGPTAFAFTLSNPVDA